MEAKQGLLLRKLLDYPLDLLQIIFSAASQRASPLDDE
jgi:hypothetical protein